MRLASLDTPSPARPKRIGFMGGQIRVPDDFDRLGEEVIHDLFLGIQ